MEERFCMEFFGKSPIAFSCHKALFNSVGIPYDYEYLAVNKAFEELMNIKGSTILHKRFFEVYTEDWESAVSNRERLQNAILNLTITQLDLHFEPVQKWVRILVFPLDKDTFGCIYQDVSKEYFLDYEVSNLLKVNLDLLCVVDLNGNFIKINHAFERILGYQFDDLKNNFFRTLIHREDVPATNEMYKKLKNQKSVSNFVNRIRGKDGVYRYLEWHAELSGKRIYASARDITETRKLETQLYQNNESLIELAAKLERKNKMLKDLAVRDELTGLYNRHYLDQWIDNELETADQEHTALSMIIFDLDHFKRVNDIWGHPIGDEVLKQTADLANRLLQEPDFLIRLGGEEFAIILPGSNLKRAMVVAECIREILEHYKFPVVGHLTASFGVAQRGESEGFDYWYKRTDKAMYRAKEAGRNRVFSSDKQDRSFNSPIKFEWKSEWESGNPEIDSDHKKLVEQANRLISKSLSEQNQTQIIQEVELILNEIVEHFRDEEQILLEIGYQDYEKHAAIHKCLLEKVFRFKEAYQNGELKLAEFFSFIVNDLIVGHILNSDSDYFQYTQKA